MDDQMERLVSLGILSKNSTSHTSPVIPLMSDVLSILGNSECEVVSCVDIKDAYHSIRLRRVLWNIALFWEPHAQI